MNELLQYSRSEYHTQLAKMSFDEIFDLTAGVYFYFYNIYMALYRMPILIYETGAGCRMRKIII